MDSAGVGELADAGTYGDTGSNTLGNIAKAVPLKVPTLRSLGLDRIVDIGKEIAYYDALDTGMFLCSPALFDDLESASKDGNCSLSDGMRRAARTGRLRAMEIGDAQWHDVDTPEALAYAGAESLVYA